MARLSPPIQSFINDIMKDGEKLESRAIYERLYNKLEERKSDKRLSYFKGQDFPTKLQLTIFLKRNFQN